MERIIDGILFEGKALPDAWDVRTWSVNGVTERSVRQVVEWTEIGPGFKPMAWPDYLAGFTGQELADKQKEQAQDEAERRERSRRKAALRAKTMCRRVIITEQFDELLTLTYRENQEDRALCKKHFKEWVRRMKRALPSFRYCASFERQERGSMHVHIATNKLPKHAEYKGVTVKAWQLGTKVWRAIVGDNNGLCFVGGVTKFGGRRRSLSLAKMAAYVSKYILKDADDNPDEANRYSRSNGTVVPKAEVIRLVNCSTLLAIELTFELEPGELLISHRLSRWGDSIWLCTEKPQNNM
jgi:hypothetical protein